jgi:hypothetical protein
MPASTTSPAFKPDPASRLRIRRLVLAFRRRWLALTAQSSNYTAAAIITDGLEAIITDGAIITIGENIAAIGGDYSGRGRLVRGLFHSSQDVRCSSDHYLEKTT